MNCLVWRSSLLWQEVGYFACECQWFAPKYANIYFCMCRYFYVLSFRLLRAVWKGAVACTLWFVPPGLASDCCAWAPVWLAHLHWKWSRWGEGEGGPRASRFQIPSVVTAGETVLFWFLQDSEGAQPLNLSAKPKASESKSPNSPPTSPQVPAAAAAANKLDPTSMKHSVAPSSIGGPPTRISSIGKWI